MPTRKKNNSKPIDDRFLLLNKWLITSLSLVSLGTFAQQTVTLNNAICFASFILLVSFKKQ